MPACDATVKVIGGLVLLLLQSVSVFLAEAAFLLVLDLYGAYTALWRSVMGFYTSLFVRNGNLIRSSGGTKTLILYLLAQHIPR